MMISCTVAPTPTAFLDIKTAPRTPPVSGWRGFELTTQEAVTPHLTALEHTDTGGKNLTKRRCTIPFEHIGVHENSEFKHIPSGKIFVLKRGHSGKN